MVEDLLRGFAPSGIAAQLDFAGPEQMPADYMDDGLRVSQGNALWRARYRPRAAARPAMPLECVNGLGRPEEIGKLAINCADGA